MSIGCKMMSWGPNSKFYRNTGPPIVVYVYVLYCIHIQYVYNMYMYCLLFLSHYNGKVQLLEHRL